MPNRKSPRRRGPSAPRLPYGASKIGDEICSFFGKAQTPSVLPRLSKICSRRSTWPAVPVHSAVLDVEAILVRADNTSDFDGLRSRQGQQRQFRAAVNAGTSPFWAAPL